MQRVSLRRAGERVKGGYSLSRKRITPFKSPKRKVLTLQASSSKSCDACRLHFPARGIAAFSVAIRFASAPIICCRSAHLVEVQPNFRLPPVSTMRRASAMPHSVGSLPPDKRHSRLTIVRRGCKRSRLAGVHGEAMYTAPDSAGCAALRAARLQWRGQGARPLAFSWGI